jgi:hypothetical protein
MGPVPGKQPNKVRKWDQCLVNAVTGKVVASTQVEDARHLDLGDSKDREAICSE